MRCLQAMQPKLPQQPRETSQPLPPADFIIPDLFGPDDVLNGIAYDEKSKRFFITGKNWPNLFVIKLENAGERFVI